jgi:hypothetical protein
MNTNLIKAAMFLTLGSVITPSVAQKNAVLLDPIFIPTSQLPIVGISAGYYRHVTPRRAYGVSALYVAALIGPKKNVSYQRFGLVDLVHQYRLWHKKRSGGYGALGLSTMWYTLKRPANPDYEPDASSPEAYAKWQAYNSKPHWKTEHFMGFAAHFRWEYSLSKRWKLGAAMVLNPYFSKKLGFELFMMPTIHSACYF